MEIHLVGESIKFMILGMLIVFVFLIILVEIMKLQAKIINKYFSEKELELPVPVSKDEDEESRRIAAIIAAVAEFRKK